MEVNELARVYRKIFRIRITSTTTRRLLRFIAARLKDKQKFTIVTPNPEICLKANKDFILYKSIEKSDWSIPDGIGLKWAAKFMDGTELNVIHGRKLFLDIVKFANKKGLRLAFFGARNGVAYKTKLSIEQNFKNLKIIALDAPEFNYKGLPATAEDRKLEHSALAKIKMFEADIIFVGVTTPIQEKWIYKNLYYLNCVGAMTVGATFDYLAGDMKLPPKWMEKLELEWLFRLITNPQRYRRILNAILIFPIQIFKYKYFKNTFLKESPWSVHGISLGKK